MEPQDKPIIFSNTDAEWGFSKVWNASLSEREDRPLEQRDHLWASELGKSPIDVWLKLRAVPATNPPNPRSLRKFEAGNVFEWIVSLILKRAGILQDAQHYSSFQYPGLLKVTGKADFIAGGKPDYEKWQHDITTLEMPQVFIRAGESIIKYFQETYPNGLPEKPLEIKSVGSFMFESMERSGMSSKIHRIQTFHYLKSEERPRANLVYICRDDLRIMEFPVLNPSYVEDEYRRAIANLSEYHLKDEKPPLEKAILWDEDLRKFVKNFNISYSGYLTLLYGYRDQMEYDDQMKPIVDRWNRVMGRIKRGDKMTPKNLDVIREVEDQGFSIDEIKEKFVDDETKVEE